MSVSVILHNIRSTHNVGAIFRTADGAGVSHIFLTGYTPAPLDRFGRPEPGIAKTALGATDTVPWESHGDIHPLLDRLKREGKQIVSVEQAEGARDYRARENEYTDTVFIFGNEVEGVPADVLAASDFTIFIPMHGAKESLNVSVAAGIVLFNTCTE